MGNLGAPDIGPYDPIKFEGYVKSMRTNERDGEMMLTIAVPPEYKFIALLTTDFPGTMFNLTFLRQNHEADSDDTADEPDTNDPPLEATHQPAPPRFEPWQTT